MVSNLIVRSRLTCFSFCITGGINATALAKFVQHEDVNWNMALVTDKGKFIQPQNYYPILHQHLKPLELFTGAVSAQVKSWSKVDIGKKVVKYMPD